jgi:hypothetical protein
MDFIGEEFEPAQLDYSNSPHHNIDGNRMRFRGGSAIVADTRYLIDMRPYQWAMATAWAFRGLRRFDYPLSRRKMRAAIFS